MRMRGCAVCHCRNMWLWQEHDVIIIQCETIGAFTNFD